MFIEEIWKKQKCVHILYTEETKYTLFNGSMSEGILRRKMAYFMNLLQIHTPGHIFL